MVQSKKKRDILMASRAGRPYQKVIKVLLALSILLGFITILTIRTIVPSFVVESASLILAVYIVSLVFLFWRWSPRVLSVPMALSLFTIAAVFSTTAHIKLIEEGYLPAIAIISSGLISQAALFIFSVLSLVKRDNQ